MSFEIGRTINDISDRVLKVPIVRAVADNPVYSAIFIALMVMCVLFIIYTEDRAMTTLRVGFWTAVLTLLTLFLRDRFESNTQEAQSLHAVTHNLFANPPLITETMPILPSSGSGDKPHSPSLSS